jgi:hypothetical protein
MTHVDDLYVSYSDMKWVLAGRYICVSGVHDVWDRRVVHKEVGRPVMKRLMKLERMPTFSELVEVLR